LEYIKSNNFAISRRLADSKLKTKEFLQNHKIAVPATLAIFTKHKQIQDEVIDALEPPFVVKPNNGYGGKGIYVFEEKTPEGNLVANTGQVFTPSEFKEHLHYIIDGFFSLSGGRDTVVIEKKIILTKDIELLGKYGLPDLRVICYNMVPVMAMMRIPTEESGGKANLHGGACGVGIDIGTGKLTYITKGSKIVKSIPGIGDVRGIILPHWDEILHLSVKVQQVTNIGYLGCDVVIDERDGPLLLEMNIRAGLEVQVANLAPLKSRLKRVE
jgi:alpha-L-glutamate ligase-like protein